MGVKKGTDGVWRIAADSTTERKPPRYTKPITADKLIAELDEAEIKRAVVLSEAFWLGGPGPQTTKRMTEMKDEATGVRGENDWTAQQVARYPDRLVLACAVDPLKDYAIPELERCAKTLKAKAMKLNFSGLGFSFDNSEQLEKIARFFKAANNNRIAIVVHLEPGRFYGPSCGCMLGIIGKTKINGGELYVSQFDFITAGGKRIEQIGVMPDLTVAPTVVDVQSGFTKAVNEAENLLISSEN